MSVREFCSKVRITEDQFYGISHIKGDFTIDSDIEIPDYFSPVIFNGDLVAPRVTNIGKGFNPTVDGNIILCSIKELKSSYLFASRTVSLESLKKTYDTTIRASELNIRNPLAYTDGILDPEYSFHYHSGGKYIFYNGIFGKMVYIIGDLHHIRTYGSYSVDAMSDYYIIFNSDGTIKSLYNKNFSVII